MDIKFYLTEKSKQQLSAQPKLMAKGLIEGMKKAMLFLEGNVKKGFGQPGRPKVRSGNLRRSIQTTVSVRDKVLVGTIGSNLIYARAQELGATIRPKVSQYLVFKINGQWIKTKKVTLPPRPFLGPVINNNLNRVKSILENSVIEEMNK